MCFRFSNTYNKPTSIIHIDKCFYRLQRLDI
nr:MAG TPA: hypothetical protein [Bacteriophage sp.]